MDPKMKSKENQTNQTIMWMEKVAKEEKVAMSETMPRLLQDSTSSA